MKSNNKCREVLENILTNFPGGLGQYPEIYNQIKDVLNEPLRNCDIDETPIEQYNRWEIEVWHKCKDDCEYCNKWFDKIECFANWSKQKYNGENK